MVGLTPAGPSARLPREPLNDAVGGVLLRSDLAIIAGTGNNDAVSLMFAVIDPSAGTLIAYSPNLTVPGWDSNVDMFPIDEHTAGFFVAGEAPPFGFVGLQYAYGTVTDTGVATVQIVDYPHGTAAHVYNSSGLGHWDSTTQRYSTKYWTEYTFAGPFVGFGIVVDFPTKTTSSYPLLQYMGAGEDLGDIYYGTYNLPDGRYIAARNNWQLRHKPDDSDRGSQFFVVDQDGQLIYTTPNYGALNYNDDLTIRQVGRTGLIGLIWSFQREPVGPIATNPMTLLILDTTTPKFQVVSSHTFGEAYPFDAFTLEQRMTQLNNEDDINTLGVGYRAMGNQLSAFGGFFNPTHDYASVQVPANGGFAIGTLDRPLGLNEGLDGGGDLALLGNLVLYFANDLNNGQGTYYRLFGAAIAATGPRLNQRDDGLGIVGAPRLVGNGAKNSPTSATASAAPRIGGANTY